MEFALLIQQLRPLLHPILVHFPIVLLLVSTLFDWAGYWLKRPSLTRTGFYVLVLGAFSAGIAALAGPDHATGDASVPALLAAHQNFAVLTVGLAVALTAWRFLAARGIGGAWALLYLGITLVPVAAVTLAGYYGGELTYHHGVGVSVVPVPAASGPDVRPIIPTHPFVALVGFLAVVGLIAWVTFGRTIAPRYFPAWWRAVRGDLTRDGSDAWILWR
jgi:uncharacterized membrane protein